MVGYIPQFERCKGWKRVEKKKTEDVCSQAVG